jgi:Flp pilus assembly protein TadB
MATRKQRRRREKSFRHEYEFVERDEEGNETPVERIARERAEKKPTKTGRNGRQQPAKSKAKRSRPVREVPPPTWQRALKRGGLMGVGMFVLFVFVIHSGSQAGRALTAVIYAVFFVPLTYWADRLAYRTYLRRSGAASADKPKR